VLRGSVLDVRVWVRGVKVSVPPPERSIMVEALLFSSRPLTAGIHDPTSYGLVVQQELESTAVTEIGFYWILIIILLSSSPEDKRMIMRNQ